MRRPISGWQKKITCGCYGWEVHSNTPFDGLLMMHDVRSAFECSPWSLLSNWTAVDHWLCWCGECARCERASLVVFSLIVLAMSALTLQTLHSNILPREWNFVIHTESVKRLDSSSFFAADCQSDSQSDSFENFFPLIDWLNPKKTHRTDWTACRRGEAVSLPITHSDTQIPCQTGRQAGGCE